MNLGFKFSTKNGMNLLSQFHADETEDSAVKQSLLDKNCSTSDLNAKRNDRTTSTTFFLPVALAATSTATETATAKFKANRKLNLTSDFLRKIKAYYKK